MSNADYGLAHRIEEAARVLGDAKQQIVAAVRDTLVAQWRAIGGCEKCYGWQSVVTWSTLDGPSWTEYGQCTACTDQSRAAGKAPFSRWWGGYHAAGLDMPRTLPANVHAEDAARVATLQQAIDQFTAAAEAERARTDVRKGRAVEVVKGRKVPIGTRGAVIWIGDGQYGERCGIKDAAGNVHWTATRNVQVQGSGRWPDLSPALLQAIGAIFEDLAMGRALLHPVAFAAPAAPAAAPASVAAPAAPAAAQQACTRAQAIEADNASKGTDTTEAAANLTGGRASLLEID